MSLLVGLLRPGPAPLVCTVPAGLHHPDLLAAVPVPLTAGPRPGGRPRLALRDQGEEEQDDEALRAGHVELLSVGRRLDLAPSVVRNIERRTLSDLRPG